MVEGFPGTGTAKKGTDHASSHFCFRCLCRIAPVAGTGLVGSASAVLRLFGKCVPGELPEKVFKAGGDGEPIWFGLLER